MKQKTKKKKDCDVGIVPNNLKNLIIYQQSSEVKAVSSRLQDGTDFVGSRIFIKLSDLELLHAIWVFDYHNDISKEK